MTKKTYEPEPEVPEELQERYEVMVSVLQGKLSVSEGARRLGMSRNHFQTLLHRGLKGLLGGITPGAPGRPGKPEREAELERENEKLRRELERLRSRGEMIDRLLGVASGVIRGRVEGAHRRERRPKATSGDDDPEGLEIAMRVEAERELREAGLTPPLSCAVVGASPATLRRWRRRLASPPLPAAAAHGAEIAPELRDRVAALVRALRGLIGADALRHAVPGVSRRQASRVKRQTLLAMERERVGGAERVVVTAAGAVRGFDAMHVTTTGGVRWPLVAADAAVPLRTTVTVAGRYDGVTVAETLEQDFTTHGAPLVLRADRCKAHDTPEVEEVLRAHGVLLLHGPAHHPGYYGQLERQNREHRAWLDSLGALDPDALEEACARMHSALNSLWPRRSLGWKTSLDVWQARNPVAVDRTELRTEVQDRAARIRRHADGRPALAAMAERLAIEQVLTNRGLLRREPGGWC